MIRRIDTLVDRSWLFRAFTSTPGIIVLLLVAAVSFGFASIPSQELSLAALQFELAGTTDGALSILRTFAGEGILDRVRIALAADFVLIMGYSFGLAGLAWRLGRRNAADPQALVHHIVWGALWAGFLDELENFALIFMVWQFVTSSDPLLGIPALLSTLLAVTKWTFVVGVVAHTIWSAARQVIGRNRPRGGGAGKPTGRGGGGSEVEEAPAPIRPSGLGDTVFEPDDEHFKKKPEKVREEEPVPA